jgi:hypothetical protein
MLNAISRFVFIIYLLIGSITIMHLIPFLTVGVLYWNFDGSTWSKSMGILYGCIGITVFVCWVYLLGKFGNKEGMGLIRALFNFFYPNLMLLLTVFFCIGVTYVLLSLLYWTFIISGWPPSGLFLWPIFSLLAVYCILPQFR